MSHAHLQFAELLLDELHRREERALRAAGAQAGRPLRYQRRQLIHVDAVGTSERRHRDGRRRPPAKELAQAAFHQLAGIFAGHGKHVLADYPCGDVAALQDAVDALLDIVRLPLLDEQHRLLAPAEINDFRLDEGIDHVHHVHGQAGFAERIGTPHMFHGPVQGVVQPSRHDDAHVAEPALEHIVERLLPNEINGGGPAPLHLLGLLRIVERRQHDALHITGRRVQGIGGGEGGTHVILRVQYPGDMAGAYPKLQHDRGVRCLGKLETVFHGRGDAVQVGARVEQPHL